MGSSISISDGEVSQWAPSTTPAKTNELTSTALAPL